MAEEKEFFLDELEKFKKNNAKILSMVYKDESSFRDNLASSLDQLNSIEYSFKVAEEEVCGNLLKQCCFLVPIKEESLMTKVCQLCINIISRQQIILNTGLEIVVEYFMSALQICSPGTHPEVLQALGTVIYENGGKLTKLYEDLIGQHGMLFELIENGDEETKRGALQCVENLCIRTPNIPYFEAKYQNNCLQILLKILHTPKPENCDELAYCRFIVSALRGIQNILLATKVAEHQYLGPLLAALRVYSQYGLPGASEQIPSCLYPTPLSQYDPSPKRVTPKEDDGEVSLRPSPTKTPTTSKGEGKKSKRKPKSNKKTQNRNEDQVEGAARGIQQLDVSDSPANQQVSGTSGIEVLTPRKGWNRLSSSESDFSDTEGGQISKLRSFYTKVRQCALGCFLSVIKATDKRVMFGYWSSFIPDTPGIGGSPQTSTIFTTIMKDTSPKARTWALAVLTGLLEGSKQYLAAAEDSDQRKAAFTSYSVTLGYMIKEIHRCLLLALVSENSPLSITQIIKCLATLVASVPYHRLKPGLLSRVVKQIKPFIGHRDPNIRVACLTCLGSVVSAHAPLLEVCHILHSSKPQRRTTSLSESTSQGPSLSNSLNVQSFETSVATSEGTTENQESGYSSASNSGHCTGPESGDAQEKKSGSTTPQLPSGMQTPTFTEPVIRPNEISWVLKLCVRNIAPSMLQEYSNEGDQSPRRTQLKLDTNQPLPVRLESLQLMAQLAKGYFPFVRNCLSLVKDVIHCCLEDRDPAIQLHGAKILDEVGSIMQQQLQDTSVPQHMDQDQVAEFWNTLLSGPIPTVMQVSACQAVRSTACDCISNIGEKIFEKLPLDKRILCITLLLGLTSDEDYRVRAAAVRALGVYISYLCLREDVSFVADTANAILNSLSENNLNVKIKASWSLGNLSDALVLNKEGGDLTFVDDFSDLLLLKLFEVATRGAHDNDKVKSNAVRALGNLLRYLPERSYGNTRFGPVIDQSIQALVKTIGSGTMKVRWNACYAAGNLFKNKLLPVGETQWTAQVHNALAAVVRDCKNFKVRINAALAFAAPMTRKAYGDLLLFTSIWESLIKALESADMVTDFSEYKYRDYLTEQVCATLLHLVGMLAPQDLESIAKSLRPKREVVTKYLQSFVQQKSKTSGTISSEIKTAKGCILNFQTEGLTASQLESLDTVKEMFGCILAEPKASGTEVPPKTRFVQSYD